ncbi:MAG: leucine-rich repeat domain-containing protein [Candidatus Hodarchaeales archaeon]
MADPLTEFWNQFGTTIAAATPGLAAVLLALYNRYMLMRGAILEPDPFVTYGLSAFDPVEGKPRKIFYFPILVNNSGSKTGLITDVEITFQGTDEEKILYVERRVEVKQGPTSRDLLSYRREDFQELVPQFPAYVPPNEGSTLLLECIDYSNDVVGINEELTCKVVVKYGSDKSSTMTFPFKLTSIDLSKVKGKVQNEIGWLRTTYEDTGVKTDQDVLREVLNKAGKEDRFERVVNRSYVSRAIKFRGTKFALLDLSKIQLSHLPEEIANFTELEELVLDDNLLEELPAAIGQLKKLKKLSIEKNKLKSLPDSIGDVNSLESLVLYYNELTTLPETISNLSSLSVLSLTGNKLKKVPASVGKLGNLKQLYLDRNEIEEFPLLPAATRSLEYLNLYKNKITEVPADIGSYQSLIGLSLYENEIRSLPEEIGLLKNLQRLDFRDNQLETLPESMYDLKDFRELGYNNKGFSEEVKEKIKVWVDENKERKLRSTNMSVTFPKV